MHSALQRDNMISNFFYTKIDVAPLILGLKNVTVHFLEILGDEVEKNTWMAVKGVQKMNFFLETPLNSLDM